MPFNRIIIIFCTSAFLVFANNTYPQTAFTTTYQEGLEAIKDSDYELASSKLNAAISSFNTSEDSTDLGLCFLNLSRVHAILDQYDLSFKYALTAKTIFSKIDNKVQLVSTLNILGNLSSVRNDLDQAVKHYKQALKLGDSLGYYDKKSSILINIGVALYNQEKYTQAIENYKDALDIAIKLNNNHEKNLALINIGISQFELNDKLKALENIEKGLQGAQRDNDLYILQQGHQQLSIFNEIDGDYEKAYFNHLLYNQYKDSMNSTEKASRVIALEKKYDSKRKELEILKLTSDKQKSELKAITVQSKLKSLNTSIRTLLIAFALMGVLSYFFYKQYRLKMGIANDLSLNKEELEVKNAKLNESINDNNKLQNALKQDLNNYKDLAYRKQMNPHFIFNSLNAIQHYILTNNKLDANLYLGELSSLIRRILENSEEEFISLKEELEVTEKYILLEQKRFKGKFNYVISNECTKNILDIKVPPLIIQPFVENAIWHGILHKNEQANLQIVISDLDIDKFLIIVKDNGVGRNYTPCSLPKNKTKSMGIDLTNERIKLHNYLNHNKLNFEITDIYDESNLPAGTEVRITIEIC